MTVDGYRTDTLDLPQNVPTRGTDDAFGRMVHDHWRGAYAGVGRAQRVRGPSRVRRGPGDWPTTVPDGVRRAVGRWVSLLLLSREAAIRAVAPMSWRLVDTIDGGGSRYYLQLER